MNTCKILVRKSEVNRPFWSPRHKGEENIKVILKTGCDGVKSIHMAQDTVP
jgi:hypothetical protein